MVAWEDDFTTGFLPGFLHVHGESATYDYADGTADATITVYAEELIGALDEKEYAWFGVRKSDVAAPQEGDAITVDGVAWVVTEIRNLRDGTWNLRCFSPKLRP
jgi:hypothetical protein